jgi:hypothetical protein
LIRVEHGQLFSISYKARMIDARRSNTPDIITATVGQLVPALGKVAGVAVGWGVDVTVGVVVGVGVGLPPISGSVGVAVGVGLGLLVGVGVGVADDFGVAVAFGLAVGELDANESVKLNWHADCGVGDAACGSLVGVFKATG